MHIYDYKRSDLEKILEENNIKKYRAIQLYNWLYRQKISSFNEILNINKEELSNISNIFQIDSLKLRQKQVSKDQTVKFLFELSDNNLIESVLMNHDYGYSLCVTCQVGCNMGCKFCASGIKKKVRDLYSYEMVLQVLTVSILQNIRISHIVIMGIGEPFDNYNNILNFLEIVNDPQGLEIGSRHMTISTCGLVSKIYEYTNFHLQVNLALSLHSAIEDVRKKIMPIANSYSLSEIRDALLYYTNKTKRKVTLEYILLEGINDSISDMEALYNFSKDILCYINLIPYNEVKENDFKRTKLDKRIKCFDYLKKKRLNVVLRKEQGHDIDAACGQLRSNNL